MKHTIGSILQFTPTTTPGLVHFHAPDGIPTDWAEPLIGWAVIVNWNSEPDDEDTLGADFGDEETQLLPVVLDQGTPSTTRQYEDSHHHTTFRAVTLS